MHFISPTDLDVALIFPTYVKLSILREKVDQELKAASHSGFDAEKHVVTCPVGGKLLKIRSDFDLQEVLAVMWQNQINPVVLTIWPQGRMATYAYMIRVH